MARRGPRGHAVEANIVTITCDEVADDGCHQANQAPGTSTSNAAPSSWGHPLVKGIESAFHGRLGRSPEPRVSKAGRSFATFSLAVATGAEEVTWVSVVAFGETAEALAGLASGTSIYCEGTLRLEEFTKKDGTSASQLKVSASVALPLGQIGNKRRSAPAKKAAKRPDPQAPLGMSGHGGPNDPLGF